MKRQRVMRSWTLEACTIAALSAGCGSPAPTPSGASVPPAQDPAQCSEGHRRVEEARRELAAGRLLRVLALTANAPSACRDDSTQLAALSVEASASLGDVETVKKSAGGSALFGPDKLPTSPASVDDERVVYDRAAAAYRAGDFIGASSHALTVGAHAGRFAADAFVLAARSAQRVGDQARAARMWARAYRLACPKTESCTVGAPRDDLFGRAAQYGAYAPWSDADLCSRAIHQTGTVVNGKEYITEAEGGYEIREIPSRVLFERVDAPSDVDLVCFSRDGRRRIAMLPAKAPQKSATLLASRNGAWTSVSIPLAFWPEDVVHVGNDGLAILPALNITPDHEVVSFGSVDPARAQFTALNWTPTISSRTWGFGPNGAVYAGFRVSGPPGKRKAGLARYNVGQSQGVVLYEDDGPVVGPVDEQDRVLFNVNSKLVWLDGKTGRVLAEAKDPIHQNNGYNWLGVVPPSTVVWFQGDLSVHTVDVATGAIKRGGLVWQPTEASSSETDVENMWRELPVGSSGKTWKEFQGWHVLIHRQGETVLGIHAPQKPDLRAVMSRDGKGAFVVATDGHFEFIGEVSDAFRASASCRSEQGSTARALAVEVCGAALEDAGLVETWLGLR